MIVAAFDTETTGTDPDEARIVTAALVLLDDAGQVVDSLDLLIDPGVPIPDEAAAIHGITTEYAHEFGVQPAAAIAEIRLTLNEWADHPLAVYNAPFDLTILDRELRRHGVDERGLLAIPRRPILDPLVIDKHLDTYRRGSRKLVDVAALHGVTLDHDEAHRASADATATGRLAQHFLAQPAFAGATLDAIHDAEIRWARTQADSLADYFHRIGQHDRAESVTGSWPYRAPRSIA